MRRTHHSFGAGGNPRHDSFTGAFVGRLPDDPTGQAVAIRYFCTTAPTIWRIRPPGEKPA